MEQADPVLERMATIAQPLDEWCDFCGLHLAVQQTDSGTPICAECAAQVLEAMRRYAEEAEEAAQAVRHRPVTAKQAKARAKRRAKRKRTGR